MNEKMPLSCANCMAGSCSKADGKYPSFCLTTGTEEELVSESVDHYLKSRKDRKIALTAAEIEGNYYGKLTRVEEVLLFIKKMGYKKVGVATCVGLIAECNQFAKIAKAKGIEVYAVACKVGAVDKSEIGVLEADKIKPGKFEALCNPVLQAKLLNEAGCDFNVVIGLCVGHDTLFIKHSKAPVTYLIVKDRVLAHNPAACLYTANFYYKRLLTEELEEL